MSQKLRYMVVIEAGETSYGAYVPDLPGCVAVGETREEALELVKEAVEFHLEDLREKGESIPKPRSSGEVVDTIAV
jgi:predicted RNase H-like HicB family nuclease